MSTLHYEMLSVEGRPLGLKIKGVPPFFYENLTSQEPCDTQSPLGLLYAENKPSSHIQGEISFQVKDERNLMDFVQGKAGNDFYLRILIGDTLAGQYYLQDIQALDFSVAPGHATVLLQGYSGAAIYPIQGIWEKYAAGDLTRTGEWKKLSLIEKVGWLRVGLSLMSKNNSVAGSLVINGADVSNEVDFYCSLGEAIFGILGYAGWNPQAMHERLDSIPGSITIDIESIEEMANRLDPNFWETAVEIANECNVEFQEKF